MSDQLLKWVGGKTRLLPHILTRLPSTARRYVEPFCGSAAVFFAYHPVVHTSWINDANPELIGMFTAIQLATADVVRELAHLSSLHGEVLYYKVRDSFNAREHTLGSPQRAAQFLYLNRGGYNGLWRVNQSGGFNVPWNRRNEPLHCPAPKTFAEAWRALQGATVTHCSFDLVMRMAGPGDVFYCDPPYPGTFDGYTTEKFSDDQHRLLADLCFQAADRGARVLLSISDHPLSRELYAPRGAVRPVLDPVTVRHAVGATEARRGDVAELLITLAKE